MKGEAHDNLHAWLFPHLDLVKELDKVEQEEVEVVIEKLNTSFELFNRYFE